jgi:hypothetical protein
MGDVIRAEFKCAGDVPTTLTGDEVETLREYLGDMRRLVAEYFLLKRDLVSNLAGDECRRTPRFERRANSVVDR